jgi:hypothetical protein
MIMDREFDKFTGLYSKFVPDPTRWRKEKALTALCLWGGGAKSGFAMPARH